MIHPKPGHDLPEPLANLQTTHPAWSIWTSQGGRGCTPCYYASRLTPSLTTAGLKGGLVMTLAADTPQQRADLLAEQDTTEQQLAGSEVAA